MKKAKYLLLILALFFAFAFTSCGSENGENNTNTDTTQDTSEDTSSTSQFRPGSVKFEGQTILYDGEVHSLVATGYPEDAEVTYTGNGQTEPGSHSVKCVVKVNGKEYKYEAILNIQKLDSVLAIETTQTVESGSDLVYTLNNTEQKLTWDRIYPEGTYYVDAYCAATDHYKESAHFEVKVTVVAPTYDGITFVSTTKTANGSEQELLASNVDTTKYNVVYENNKLTEQGSTKALCKIYEGEELKATLKAIFTLDNPTNEEFDAWVYNFLCEEYFADDYYAWNVFFFDPLTSVGFDRDAYDFGDAEWYSYYPIDEEFKQEGKEEIGEMYNDFHDKFDDALLSYAQLDCFKQVSDMLDFYVDYYADSKELSDYLINVNYVDQYGGYCADLSSTVENYNYLCEQDVIDVINYLISTTEVYPTYLTYVQDKIDAGYPLSDFTLNEFKNYLSEVLGKDETTKAVLDGSDYYLINYFKEKINALDFLDEAKKASYCSQAEAAFTEHFMPATKALYDAIDQYKGHVGDKEGEDPEGYWSTYENGLDLYLAELRDTIGDDDITLEEFNNYIKTRLNQSSKTINDIIKEYRAMSQTNQNLFYNYISGKSVVDIDNPTEMIDYLMQFSKFFVPDLETNPDVRIKYMDKTEAENTTAVAYYHKSAVDKITTEWITLNPKHTGDDSNDTLSTMAHEGYPGHLYAYVFKKSTPYNYYMKFESDTCFNEGWATYVQLSLYDYLKEHANGTPTEKKMASKAIDYYIQNQLCGYLIYAEVEYMIYVEDAKPAEISKFMGDNGFNDSMETAWDIYRTLIESPCAYLPYSYGMIKMYDIHENCKKALGSLYNEVDYNKFVLSTSQCSLSELEELTAGYIANIKFLYSAE